MAGVEFRIQQLGPAPYVPEGVSDQSTGDRVVPQTRLHLGRHLAASLLFRGEIVDMFCYAMLEGEFRSSK